MRSLVAWAPKAAGHVFTLHEHFGGHTVTAAQLRSHCDDLKASKSPT